MGPQPSPEQTTGEPTATESDQQGAEVGLAPVVGAVHHHTRSHQDGGEQHG